MTQTNPQPTGPALSMTPTVFLVWLSHPSEGGWFDPAAREQGGPEGWSLAGPRHLSLHTSRQAAEAALLAAARHEYDEEELSYAHGPWEDHTDPLAYMRRHVDYVAHVTEQEVTLP